ncbi:MAG: 23S rRNA (uracil-C(5))-methyltransferase RlmCD [Syntrophorhabdus sp. PtaU1.Bin050]|nr:MAG: 23S rRNA (uracil-C(5))-methyltransferase RlmCD [Syntrophorhabdus sp. PtaU1.Bin050]
MNGPGKPRPDSPVDTVDIVDIALPNDYGVAREDRLVIFVPGAVIGDRVKIRISRPGKRFAYGEIVEIDTPSPFRVKPECPHFGPCGGCTLQHLAYEKQLALKEGSLHESLRRIGGIDIARIKRSSIVPSPDRYSYRSKLELAFGETGGRITLGLRERVSPFRPFTGRVIPLDECRIFSPVVEKLIPIFLDFAVAHHLRAFTPHTGKGFLKHLILREAKATGDVMATIETRPGKFPDPAGLIRRLTDDVPAVKSLYHAVNNRTDDVIRLGRLRHLYGQQFIDERLGGLTLKIHPETFFQPNGRGAALLYNEILESPYVTEGATVLGLYCGTGPIEIWLSKKARSVIGIDIDPTNITLARENCRINGVTNCTFYQGRVEETLSALKLEKPDVLVVDPPRTGMTPDSLDTLLAVNAPAMVYVSCNPATLARDLRILQDRGYSVDRVVPFDLFPHTGHLETLVFLRHSQDTGIVIGRPK